MIDISLLFLLFIICIGLGVGKATYWLTLRSSMSQNVAAVSAWLSGFLAMYIYAYLTFKFGH